MSLCVQPLAGRKQRSDLGLSRGEVTLEDADDAGDLADDPGIRAVAARFFSARIMPPRSSRRAKQTAGRNHVLFGNVDPSGVIARGTAAEVTRATVELVRQWKPGGLFVLNAGCAIPASTPSENVHALVRVAKEHGCYG